MVLTKRQAEGLKTTLERYKQKEKYVVIAGYAGTGKSTLVAHLIEALADEGIDPSKDVVFSAYTGKACQVLQNKGNKNVKTLHKLLFKSIPLPSGGYKREKRSIIEYKIVVVDECSMAPRELVNQLLNYPNIFVIFCGDSFQLPPVDKDADNHLLDNPHVFLDEIMRQAAESNIIRLSMDIRQGNPIQFGTFGDVMVIPKAELTTGYYQWADQIIAATNNTRRSINYQMRSLQGINGNGPRSGDKVICLRNYDDVFSVDGESYLVNGTIGYIEDSFHNFIKIPKMVGDEGTVETLVANFKTETGEMYDGIEMDHNQFITEEPSISWKTSYKMSKRRMKLPYSFTYGYCITCHKSQGSQFDKVLVIEEKFPFDKEEHARWLYTAVTRAAEKLILVR